VSDIAIVCPGRQAGRQAGRHTRYSRQAGRRHYFAEGTSLFLLYGTAGLIFHGSLMPRLAGLK